MRCLWKVVGRRFVSKWAQAGRWQDAHDNLVCLLCQRETRIQREVDWWLDGDERGRKVAVAG